jgi:hypothetical protein
MFQKLGNASSTGTRKTAQWIIRHDYWGRTSLLLSYAISSITKKMTADQIMEKFDQISGNDSRGRTFAKKQNYGCKANSGRYKKCGN